MLIVVGLKMMSHGWFKSVLGAGFTFYVLGVIAGSGLRLREQYAAFDAARRFVVDAEEPLEPSTNAICVPSGDQAGCPWSGPSRIRVSVAATASRAAFNAAA